MAIEYRSRQPNLTLKYILGNVALSFEQLTRLCGVSRRQLSYWIENGIVPSPDQNPLSTIERATMIRVRLQLGDTLRQAAQKLDEYHRQYSDGLRELEAMADEDRGQQLARQLEELQAQVNRLRQVLSESPAPPLDLRSLVATFRNLSLNELLTTLPHGRPTPELIIRLRQSAAQLRLAQMGAGLEGSHPLQRP